MRGCWTISPTTNRSKSPSDLFLKAANLLLQLLMVLLTPPHHTTTPHLPLHRAQQHLSLTNTRHLSLSLPHISADASKNTVTVFAYKMKYRFKNPDDIVAYLKTKPINADDPEFLLSYENIDEDLKVHIFLTPQHTTPHSAQHTQHNIFSDVGQRTQNIMYIPVQ